MPGPYNHQGSAPEWRVAQAEAEAWGQRAQGIQPASCCWHGKEGQSSPYQTPIQAGWEGQPLKGCGTPLMPSPCCPQIMLLETARRYNHETECITFLKDFTYSKDDFHRAGCQGGWDEGRLVPTD